MSDELWLNEAMIKFNKKFHKGVLNIINANAGCGKSTFIFNEFLKDSPRYLEKLQKPYSMNLDRVLYVCDTNMLKTSIIEDNGITKIMEKSDLKEAMKSKELDQILAGNTGRIKVITYSTLGWLLKQNGARYIVMNYMNVIIMDEMQNLFKYTNRFDNEDNGRPYGTVIEYLPTLVRSTLVVALSATTSRIYSGLRELQIQTNTIFKTEELKLIKKYREEFKSQCKFMVNEIKRIRLHKQFFDRHGYKIFIYTNTIKISEKYKQMLEKYGFKVEWLCSINNTIVNEDGEIIPKMNEYQLQIREGLIQTGMLPQELEVLIVNSGYETGWNLRDDKVQFAYIDSTDYDTQIQARNRIRHNIKSLTCTAIVDEDGRLFEYDQFRQLQWLDYAIGNSYMDIELDEKYLGTKLSREDKEYLVDKYAIIQLDKKEANWKTFKKDLEINEYVVHTAQNGTFVYTKEQYEKFKSTKGVTGVVDKFIKWLKDDWDKKRITCQDIMDILDIGRKSFDNLLTDTQIIDYFKQHRYKVGTIKNSKTKYLMKY